MTILERVGGWLVRAGERLAGSGMTVTIDDAASGWVSHTGRPHDRDPGEIQQLYQDALEAWRQNPIAKRIVDIITDYTVGDGIKMSATGDVGTFLDEWWDHEENLMSLRLAELVDELTRAGDLFVTLHTDKRTGMSYVRPVPKDRITAIETAENDWEKELTYQESRDIAGEPITWRSQKHPAADQADRIMLHYAINRPIGAALGESDLATMIKWLKRYSLMLEDRVRLHWALRAFLWIVTVPTRLVSDKRAQYRTPPEAGSIIVKDEGEKWEAVSPRVNGADAAPDMKAVRMMIDAGSGQPPHWRGEGEGTNLATARAMQQPAVRRLRRRQLAIRHMIVDLAYHAYRRARLRNPQKYQHEATRADFIAAMPDIDRDDNNNLADAAHKLSLAMSELQAQLGQPSSTLKRLIVRLILKFAGEPQEETIIDKIVEEAGEKEKE